MSLKSNNEKIVFVVILTLFVLFLIFALVRSFLSSEAVALLVLPSLAFARLRGLALAHPPLAWCSAPRTLPLCRRRDP